ncbi:MAG: DHH family phosphoesterase [Candidatus Nezhaarchaeota archaeon]|nr:DHH family phosphoesterase [Candidatus Nezhaarchaeota archaeon]
MSNEVESKIRLLLKESYEAAKRLLEGLSDRVLIVYHDDADGVAACALLRLALEEKIIVNTICIEKVYPQAVRRLQAKGKEPIIYVDLGGPHLKLIATSNIDCREIVVIDHHDMEAFAAEHLTVLNPESLGLDGEIYACGASLAYFFSRSIKSEVKKYASLAVIGSTEIPGKPKGLNLAALQDAVESGVAAYDEDSSKRSVLWDNRFTSAESISSKLTAMTSVGYYSGGPEKALEACTRCSWKGMEDHLRSLEERRRNAYSKAISEVQRRGLSKLGRIQWFHVKDSFYDLGTKVIGTFCSYLLYRKLVDEDKVLVGFMNMKREIPGIGDLDGEYVKVSARAPSRVLSMIEAKRLEPLSRALADAAQRVGGFGDGHAAAASGIIPKGSEEEFVKIMNEELLPGSVKDSKCASTTLETFLFPKKVEK